jgi:hypothetical protein
VDKVYKLLPCSEMRTSGEPIDRHGFLKKVSETRSLNLAIRVNVANVEL